MNRRDHVLNAFIVGVSLSFVLSDWTAVVPVVIGTLIPDIDSSFGSHRKTFHNLFVLFGFIVFSVVSGNLNYVWVGIALHFGLDLLSKRGVALAYPLSRQELRFPIGVSGSSRWSTPVTLSASLVESTGIFIATAV